MIRREFAQVHPARRWPTRRASVGSRPRGNRQRLGRATPRGPYGLHTAERGDDIRPEGCAGDRDRRPARGRSLPLRQRCTPFSSVGPSRRGMFGGRQALCHDSSRKTVGTAHLENGGEGGALGLRAVSLALCVISRY